MRTIKTILLLPILSLILSCSYNDKQVDLAITKAEELLDVSPDSSLAILDKVDTLKTKWHTSQQMRYELVRAQAQNKAYINFSTDSILKEVVDYYDTHGTANERMTARYMLGCAYRDMEDAPAALKYFNLATDIAEQDRFNCNPTTLMKIHSQMGGLYQNVGAYDMALSEDSIAEHIARQIGDTTSFIHLMWTQACSLESMNQNARAKDLLDSITVILTDNNLTEEPVLIYPMMIDSYWKNKDTNKAEQLLLEYERKTGMSPHCPDEEVADMAYFYRKGRSYLAKTLPDSAKLMFDRLRHLAQSTDMRLAERYRLLEASYYGLKESYIRKHQLDSAIKYADLYCEANDSSIAHADRELIGKMSALYRYDKYQQEAQMQNKVATERKYQLLLVIAVSIMLLMCLSFMIYRLKRRRIKDQEEKSRIMQEYKEAEKVYAERLHYISLLEQTHKNVMRLLKDELETTKTEADRCQSLYEESKKEIAKINRQYDELTNSYRSETERLKAKIDTLSRKGGISQNISRKLDLTSHPVIQKLLRHPNNPQEEIKDKDWEQLVNIYCEYYPELVHDLQHCSHITRQGFHACLLFALDIRPGEVANILGLNIQRVSNLRSEINRSLFGDRSAKNLNSNLKQKYYICTGV